MNAINARVMENTPAPNVWEACEKPAIAEHAGAKEGCYLRKSVTTNQVPNLGILTGLKS